jgi:hypothetical protein
LLRAILLGGVVLIRLLLAPLAIGLLSPRAILRRFAILLARLLGFPWLLTFARLLLTWLAAAAFLRVLLLEMLRHPSQRFGVVVAGGGNLASLAACFTGVLPAGLRTLPTLL